jgi:hypothetical protein
MALVRIHFLAPFKLHSACLLEQIAAIDSKGVRGLFHVTLKRYLASRHGNWGISATINILDID